MIPPSTHSAAPSGGAGTYSANNRTPKSSSTWPSQSSSMPLRVLSTVLTAGWRLLAHTAGCGCSKSTGRIPENGAAVGIIVADRLLTFRIIAPHSIVGFTTGGRSLAHGTEVRGQVRADSIPSRCAAIAVCGTHIRLTRQVLTSRLFSGFAARCIRKRQGTIRAKRPRKIKHRRHPRSRCNKRHPAGRRFPCSFRPRIRGHHEQYHARLASRQAAHVVVASAAHAVSHPESQQNESSSQTALRQLVSWKARTPEVQLLKPLHRCRPTRLPPHRDLHRR